MVDYTKYVLKSREELEGLLAGKDNFFVVACNKCFKEFNRPKSRSAAALRPLPRSRVSTSPVR